MTKQELEQRDLQNLLDKLQQCQEDLNTLANRCETPWFRDRLNYHARSVSLTRNELRNDIHFYTAQSCHPTNTDTTKPQTGTNAAP